MYMFIGAVKWMLLNALRTESGAAKTNYKPTEQTEMALFSHFTLEFITSDAVITSYNATA